MKYIKIATMAFAALLASSCIDQLDTYPEGGTVTQDQKDDIAAHDPSKLDADLQGMYSSFTGAMNTFGSAANIHFDYSYPAIMMILENCGADMVSKVTGYNWFSGPVNYTAKVYTSEEIELMWVRFYSTILAANAVIKSVDAETEDVSVDDLLDELLPDLMDIYEHKQIVLERVKGESPFIVRCNASLAHILVSNLVKNALLHNVDGGRLVVETTPSSLVIKNTGTVPLNADTLFRRFAHSVDRKKESNGLGLAISQAIASNSSLRLTYRWEEGLHVFSLVK